MVLRALHHQTCGWFGDQKDGIKDGCSNTHGRARGGNGVAGLRIVKPRIAGSGIYRRATQMLRAARHLHSLSLDEAVHFNLVLTFNFVRHVSTFLIQAWLTLFFLIESNPRVCTCMAGSTHVPEGTMP